MGRGEGGGAKLMRAELPNEDNKIQTKDLLGFKYYNKFFLNEGRTAEGRHKIKTEDLFTSNTPV